MSDSFLIRMAKPSATGLDMGSFEPVTNEGLSKARSKNPNPL
jgi:hypothetical protein